MKDSPAPADVEAFNHIIEAYNEKFSELKRLAENRKLRWTAVKKVARNALPLSSQPS